MIYVENLPEDYVENTNTLPCVWEHGRCLTHDIAQLLHALKELTTEGRNEQ